MNALLLPTIEFGPLILKRIIEQLGQYQLDMRLDPNRFSPREVVAHLADWEPIMRERVRIAAEQPGTVLEVFDEEEMARAHGYEHSDVMEECDKFIRERAITAAYMRTLDTAGWSGMTTHPERGPQSAENLANTILSHDMYHLEQLSAYLAAK